jgi:hypothetical protein
MAPPAGHRTVSQVGQTLLEPRRVVKTPFDKRSTARAGAVALGSHSTDAFAFPRIYFCRQLRKAWTACSTFGSLPLADALELPPDVPEPSVDPEPPALVLDPEPVLPEPEPAPTLEPDPVLPEPDPIVELDPELEGVDPVLLDPDPMLEPDPVLPEPDPIVEPDPEPEPVDPVLPVPEPMLEPELVPPEPDWLPRLLPVDPEPDDVDGDADGDWLSEMPAACIAC